MTKSLKSMIGYKFFKDNDDSLNMIRLLKIRGNGECTVLDEATNHKIIMKEDDLKDWVPLNPDAILFITTVKIPKGKDEVDDVIVATSKYLNLTVGDTTPYAVCRQSITDIFYNLLCGDESEQIVGLSVNRDDCPTNFDMRLMVACNKITNQNVFYYYRTDTLDELLDLFGTKKADEVLNKLYTGHLKYTDNPKAFLRKEDKGWCKDLRTLLKENTFQNDMNQMLGITDVDFTLSDFLVTKQLPDGQDYVTVEDELKIWLGGTFRINITDITVLEYNHDINLGDFNNSTYLFIRDNTKKLYFCVYTVDGQYLESDLEAQYNKLDVSDRWRIQFFNKYKRYQEK